MLPDCTTRAFDGCSCTDQCQSYSAYLERRGQNLGTVRKANDLTGVFTVPAWDQIIRLCLFGLLALVVWATFDGYQKQQRMDRIAQEMGR